MMQFDIKFDSDNFTDLFEKDIRKAHIMGLRQGLNKTATASKKIASDAIGSVWNTKRIPVSRIKKDINVKSRARGSEIGNMQAIVRADSKRGVSLLRFASDQRVIQMKGRAASSRPQVSLEILKGKKQSGKGAFVQFGKGRQKLLFRNPRSGKRRTYSSLKSRKRISSETGIQAQHAPSFTAMLQHVRTKVIFEHEIVKRRDKEVTQAIMHNLSKIN